MQIIGEIQNMNANLVNYWDTFNYMCSFKIHSQHHFRIEEVHFGAKGCD